MISHKKEEEHGFEETITANLDGVERRKEIRAVIEMLKEMKETLDDINNAFPDGTLEHRKAHQAMINAAKAQESFWNELKLDIAKKGVWGLLVIMIGLLLLGVSAKLGLGSVGIKG